MERPLADLTYVVKELPLGPSFPTGQLHDISSGMRTFRPVIDTEKCVKCLRCFLVCPDGAIDKSGAALEIDYDYCKGCGVCAKVCPVPCIAMVDEHAGENEGAAEMAETLDETSPSAEMGPATEGGAA